MRKEGWLLIPQGVIDYEDGWALQQRIHDERVAGRVGDGLILLQHSPCFTVGRSGGREHLLVGDDPLRGEGITVHETNRGGNITYHGPGQVVGYPILDLTAYGKDVHDYVRRLEEVALRVLGEYGVSGKRLAGFPGVWVGNRKITSIGVAVKKWVTLHGFAFNVNPNLKHFEMIVPCGIKDSTTTSLSEQLKRNIPLEEVRERIAYHFEEVFDLSLSHVTDERFIREGGPYVP